MTTSQHKKDISVHARLKIERERIGLTQQEIGALLDVSLKTVTRWEKETAIPSDKLSALAMHGFDVLYVLTGVRQVKERQELSKRESCMLENYRALDDEDQAAVQRMTSALAKSVKDESA